MRDLESGLVGVIEQAGREAQTGWELYRVRLADLREVFRTDRQLAGLLVLLLLCAAPAAAQTPTTRLEWDYVATPAATVKTYAQVVAVDGIAQSAAIVCAAHATRPADTTCAIPLASLAAGAHTVSVAATLAGNTATTSISGLDPGKAPASASSPRLNITITIAIP